MSKCCKCQSTGVDVAIRNTAWCRTCFIDQLHNKFFQGLRPAKEYCRPPKGSQKLASDYGSLVIHYTDNLASLVTLELIKRYLATNQGRSTSKWKSPIDFSSIEVAWVDVGSASNYLPAPSDKEDTPTKSLRLSQDDIQSNIRSTVEALGFKFVVLKLDDLYTSAKSDEMSPQCLVDISEPSLPCKVIESTDPQPTECSTPLQDALRPLSKTSRASLISILTSSILLEFCKKAVRKKVLVKSTNSTDMAIDTLVGVSLGAGWSLDQQIGACSQIDGVMICRPLSQIVNAELRHYAELIELSHEYPSSHAFEKKQDIPSLITDFVIRLEENYPMTSSVINQTASKIGQNKSFPSPHSSSSTSRTACSLCHLSTDPKANQWRQSITLAAHGTSSESVHPDQSKSLSDKLCYSCLGLFRDHQGRPSDGLNWIPLPNSFHSTFNEDANLSMNQIENVLEEFLIKE